MVCKAVVTCLRQNISWSISVVICCSGVCINYLCFHYVCNISESEKMVIINCSYHRYFFLLDLLIFLYAQSKYAGTDKYIILCCSNSTSISSIVYGLYPKGLCSSSSIKSSRFPLIMPVKKSTASSFVDLILRRYDAAFLRSSRR